MTRQEVIEELTWWADAYEKDESELEFDDSSARRNECVGYLREAVNLLTEDKNG